MAEITKPDLECPPIPRIVWIAFGVGIVVFYLFGLTMPLVGPDEARYAQVAREMFERGDWVTPTLAGHQWFEKPALLYWLQIVAYHVFGVGEFSARLGPAIFGLGTVASLWILGRLSVPRIDFANLLAVIAATTFGLVVFSRGATFDIILTFPITAALVGFFAFYRSGTRLGLLLFYVFAGVAVLAKGLIGVVFPLAIVTCYFVFCRRMPSRTFLISLIWGTLVVVVVAATWYLPMYLQHGDPFIDEFFIQHHFQRFTSNKYRHPQRFYFYLWVLPLMTMPWMPFFLASLVAGVKDWFRRRGSNTGDRPPTYAGGSDLIAFAFAWLVVPLAFFSFSGSKLPGYILPAVPPALVITAIYVHRLMSVSRNWRVFIPALAALTLVALVFTAWLVVPRYAERDSVKSLLTAAYERGHLGPVMMLHMISYNAEFYADSIVRYDDGSQRQLYGNGEVLAEIERINRAGIVLVPVEHVHRLIADERLEVEVLADNSETAVAIVSIRGR